MERSERPIQSSESKFDSTVGTDWDVNCGERNLGHQRVNSFFCKDLTSLLAKI